MLNHELVKKIKDVALSHGTDLVGIAKVADLPEHEERISRILPHLVTVIAIAARHSLAAISTSNNQMAQFDTHCATFLGNAVEIDSQSEHINIEQLTDSLPEIPSDHGES